MEIMYEGTNITNKVDVRSCVSTDTCGERCDSLDIEFQYSPGWYKWDPKEDDRIQITHNGYDTGIMYVNTILPEDNRYRIIATSLPCKSRSNEWKSFYKKSISEIMGICASSAGMGQALFGVNGGTVIEYIERRNETSAKFLSRLMEMEGAVLKCVNGKLTGIGILYAQGLPAQQTIHFNSEQLNTLYTVNGSALKSVTIATPKGTGVATDSAVSGTHSKLKLTDCLPVADSGQAKRWAKGKLLNFNRLCESVAIESKFNAGYTAMARIDLEGNTKASGQWLIGEVEHDFINLSSNATLYRCISSIS